MFERFTKDARSLVTTAVGWAEADDSARVDALHLLTAVVDSGRTAAGTGALDLLAAIDARPGVITDRVSELRRYGGLSEADRRALRDLGIDVDTVVARVEDRHGEGALAAGTADAGDPGRRRNRWHLPFGDDAKRVLEASLREAQDVRDDAIGGEHILSALATVPGPAADVLAAVGASPDRLRRALLQRRNTV
ncbi:Clp amino terminal domain-containing protein, pathogenicity island component [Prauserella flava]|nr:Clp amino terminal domain-containing protein, pathogenicity island component [Prauserella flava]MCR3736381.1 Clp amino terminal domain-containing protein, pathogenicity island component [Prauserella salsuginis]